MAMDFPAFPAVGQEFVSGTVTYVYNGTGWVVKGSTADQFVVKSGDTMTGHLGLIVGPSANHAVRKDYVDAADAAIGSSITTGDALKVNKSGDTMTGDLFVTKTTPKIALQTAGATQNRIEGWKDSTLRWVTLMPHLDPETGANVGSSYQIARYSDAGSFLAFALGIARDTGNVIINATTASTSPTTGALTVAGGVGVGGALDVAGTVSLGGGGTGSSLADLRLNGGSAASGGGIIRFKKNGTDTFLVGNVSSVFGSADSGLSFYSMGAAEVMRLDYTGGVKVVPTTASTSPTTGALTVAGGVGIGGQLHVGTAGSVVARLALYGGAGSGEGANISIQKGGVFNWVFGSASCILGGTSDDFLIFASGVGNEAFRISTADRSVSIKSTTASTSSTTGALVVSGGVGIGGAISINASDSTISYSTGSPGLVLTPKDAAVGYPIVFRNNTASWIGSISLVAGQGSVSYNTTSDVRGKPNREPLLPDTARNIIDALEVYDFDKDGNAIRGIGLVAQQAYAVHKSLATPGHKDEDYWMAEKAAPMPFVIVNLQLLNNEIAELKRQLKERD